MCFGLFMLALTLGFGPAMFPAYQEDLKYYFTNGGAKRAEVGSRTSQFRQVNPQQPELTWRQWASRILMLEPVNMMSTGSRDKSELQRLKTRSSREKMSVLSY